MHVFLVRSSLHFLLATALANRMRSTGICRMLFLPDVLSPELFSLAAQSWPESPFDRLEFLEPRRRLGQMRYERSSGDIRRDIERSLLNLRPDSVTVFNDREECGQMALIAARRHFPKALRQCVEDGAHSYTAYVYRSHGPLTRLRKRLRLGHHWSDVRVLGTHPLVQKFLAIHPELLRPELRSRRVESFPTEELSSISLRSFASRMCEFAGFQPQSIPAGSVLLTLSHVSYAHRNRRIWSWSPPA